MPAKISQRSTYEVEDEEEDEREEPGEEEDEEEDVELDDEEELVVLAGLEGALAPEVEGVVTVEPGEPEMPVFVTVLPEDDPSFKQVVSAAKPELSATGRRTNGRRGLRLEATLNAPDWPRAPVESRMLTPREMAG